MIHVARFPNVQAFIEVTGPFLLAREAEHNLQLGIVDMLRTEPPLSVDPPYLAAVLDGDRVVASMIRTPPRDLVLSEVDDPAALELVVDDLAGTDLPGVSGPAEHAGHFARLWSAATGQAHQLRMAERIFRLERVIPPAPVAGDVRPATAVDGALLAEWLRAFAREALGQEQRALVDVDRWLSANRTMYIWVDGGPVSMCGVPGRWPTAARIAPVYTPPELRRRGYASALVASVSQGELDAGRKACYLFTDLANPTANHIYEAIGFEPVRDVDAYDFV